LIKSRQRGSAVDIRSAGKNTADPLSFSDVDLWRTLLYIALYQMVDVELLFRGTE
jgi:hypothetical protein